ncbi:MAG: methyltransferase domain-containing protein [Chloroflexota bacterium]
MRQPHQPDSEAYNLRQRHYFERTIKRTMVPKDSPYLRRHVDEALRFASFSPGERVLEVGCGMGRYTLILARQGVRVEGLDLSPVLLDRLQAFNDGRFDIPLHCANIENPPTELEGAFDVVLGFFTLHHLHDLDSGFAAMSRILKPGGRVAFLEPNPFNPLYYLQILITPGITWQGDKGIVRMRPSLIIRAMQSAGLSRLAMVRFGFLPPFLANQRWGSRVEATLERAPIWRALLPFQLFKGERL